MRLFYGDIFLGDILTNHSFTVDEALDFLGIDMDSFCSSHGFDDWDWELLRMEV